MKLDLDPKQKQRLTEAAQTIAQLAKETGEPPERLWGELLESVEENGPVSTPAAVPPDHQLSNLRGLGREIWQGEDAQDYVSRLRGEWE